MKNEVITSVEPPSKPWTYKTNDLLISKYPSVWLSADDKQAYSPSDLPTGESFERTGDIYGTKWIYDWPAVRDQPDSALADSDSLQLLKAIEAGRLAKKFSHSKSVPSLRAFRRNVLSVSEDQTSEDASTRLFSRPSEQIKIKPIGSNRPLERPARGSTTSNGKNGCEEYLNLFDSFPQKYPASILARSQYNGCQERYNSNGTKTNSEGRQYRLKHALNGGRPDVAIRTNFHTNYLNGHLGEFSPDSPLEMDLETDTEDEYGFRDYELEAVFNVMERLHTSLCYRPNDHLGPLDTKSPSKKSKFQPKRSFAIPINVKNANKTYDRENSPFSFESLSSIREAKSSFTFNPHADPYEPDCKTNGFAKRQRSNDYLQYTPGTVITDHNGNYRKPTSPETAFSPMPMIPKHLRRDKFRYLNLTNYRHSSPVASTEANPPPSIQCLDLRKVFGNRGSNSDELKTPRGFCLGMNDEVIVADTGNNRIRAYFRGALFAGQAVDHFRSGVKANFSAPSKVAVIRRTGHVVVCDQTQEGSRLQVFREDGFLVQEIAIPYVQAVASMVINHREHIALLDSSTTCVFIVNPWTGLLKKKFDCSEIITQPSDMAVFDGHYFISDSKGLDSVVVLNENGLLVSSFGDYLSRYSASGIDVSNEGEVFVGYTNEDKFKVCVFDLSGQLTSSYTSHNAEASDCSGLRISRQGHILTLSKEFGHVVIFDRVRHGAWKML